MKKKGFTLAEVLITLTILGIVSAISIPSIINQQQKKSTEVKLLKFYRSINKAFDLYQAENGVFLSTKGRTSNNYNTNVEFFKEFAPYIKYNSYSKCLSNSTAVCIYLNDNSLLLLNIASDGADLTYFLNGKIEKNPKNVFVFEYSRTTDTNKYPNSIEPYSWGWNGNNIQQLKTTSGIGCNKNASNPAYCAKLIQLNGWKIPKDYPW